MSRKSTYRFCLYIAGDAPNSSQALANLTTLCDTYLRGRSDVETVDVFQEPKRALAEGIFMTPTLVKLLPLPARRIVGSLSQLEPLLRALDLEGKAP